MHQEGLNLLKIFCSFFVFFEGSIAEIKNKKKNFEPFILSFFFMLDNNHNSLGLTLNLVPLEVEKTLTTLHAAALDKKNGLVEALRFLKQNQNKILEVVNNNDNNNLQTPMHLSSQSGMLDITKLLMEKVKKDRKI